MEASVDSTLLHLVKSIRSRYLSVGDKIHEVDFGQFIRYFTMDVIADVGYGNRFGFLDGKDEEYKYTESVEQLTPLIALIADVPILRRFFVSPVTAYFFAPTGKDKYGFGRIIG